MDGHDIPARALRRGGGRHCGYAGGVATVLLALSATLSGCAATSYYLQSVAGQIQILARRQDMEQVLADPTTPPAVRVQLEVVPGMLGFAEEQLRLPAGGSYGSFVQLDRPFVAWNLFAAPALSLEGRKWCYPVAGCLGYRGYFSRAAAEAEAARLRQADFDVFVGGVTAYSTLGWFDDPVLSSMLRGDSLALAALLFHELAHRKLWVPGDTELNEAFAETVARIGVRRYSEWSGAGNLEQVDARAEREDRFFRRVLDVKRRLQALYASDRPESAKRTGKRELFAGLRAGHKALSDGPHDTERFEQWLETDLNNAKLLAVSEYRELMPGLMRLFDESGRDLETFYGRVKRLKFCPPQTRRRLLESGGAADKWEELNGKSGRDRLFCE